LNSKIAVEASVHVVRAFVRLRQMLATHNERAAKQVEKQVRTGSRRRHRRRCLRHPPSIS
jgi:hypothetical protein